MKLPVSAAREKKQKQTNEQKKPNKQNKKPPPPPPPNTQKHKTKQTNRQKNPKSKQTNKKATPNRKVSVINCQSEISSGSQKNLTQSWICSSSSLLTETTAESVHYKIC